MRKSKSQKARLGTTHTPCPPETRGVVFSRVCPSLVRISGDRARVRRVNKAGRSVQRTGAWVCVYFVPHYIEYLFYKATHLQYHMGQHAETLVHNQYYYCIPPQRGEHAEYKRPFYGSARSHRRHPPLAGPRARQMCMCACAWYVHGPMVEIRAGRCVHSDVLPINQIQQLRTPCSTPRPPSLRAAQTVSASVDARRAAAASARAYRQEVVRVTSSVAPRATASASASALAASAELCRLPRSIEVSPLSCCPSHVCATLAADCLLPAGNFAKLLVCVGKLGTTVIVSPGDVSPDAETASSLPFAPGLTDGKMVSDIDLLLADLLRT